MRKVVISTKSFEDEDGKPLSFDYYVVVDELHDPDGYIEAETYGVGVCSTIVDAFARALTMNADTAERIVEKLASGLVTPTTFHDVVCDLLFAQ